MLLKKEILTCSSLFVQDASLDTKTLVSPVLAASVANLSISNLAENIQFTIRNIDPMRVSVHTHTNHGFLIVPFIKKVILHNSITKQQNLIFNQLILHRDELFSRTLLLFNSHVKPKVDR